MKAKIWLTLASAALLMNISLNPVDSPRLTLFGGVTAHAEISVDFDFFYDELAPYGDWRELEPYGWVWYPDTPADWRPYTSGYWVFTDDYGWTWISTEPWGSIPFHYGRWFYDEDYGSWAWAPDTEWGPAWVSWRSGGGFIGWAPLPPTARFELSVGSFSPRDDVGIRRNAWSFVSTPQFLSPRLKQVIAPPPRNIILIRNTKNVTRYTVINRRVVNRSIDLGRFERETRTRVKRYRVTEIDRPLGRETPVRRGRVTLFRPQVVRTTTPPPPSAVNRPNRLGWRDHRPERRGPDTAPWNPQRRDFQDRRDDREAVRRDRGFSPNSRPFEFEEKSERRSPNEQEQTRRRSRVDQAQQRVIDQRQQQRKQEQTQRRLEREQARQQQREQKQAQRRASDQQPQNRRERRLPNCRDLPPDQQQNCRK